MWFICIAIGIFLYVNIGTATCRNRYLHAFNSDDSRNAGIIWPFYWAYWLAERVFVLIGKPGFWLANGGIRKLLEKRREKKLLEEGEPEFPTAKTVKR